MEIVEFIEVACECQLTNAEKEFVRSVEKRYKEHGRLCYISPRSNDGLLELHFLWAMMVAFYEPKRKASPYGSYIDDFWSTENDWLEGNEVHVVGYAEFPYGIKEEDLIEDFYY